MCFLAHVSKWNWKSGWYRIISACKIRIGNRKRGEVRVGYTVVVYLYQGV